LRLPSVEPFPTTETITRTCTLWGRRPARTPAARDPRFCSLWRGWPLGKQRCLSDPSLTPDNQRPAIAAADCRNEVVQQRALAGPPAQASAPPRSGRYVRGWRGHAAEYLASSSTWLRVSRQLAPAFPASAPARAGRRSPCVANHAAEAPRPARPLPSYSRQGDAHDAVSAADDPRARHTVTMVMTLNAQMVLQLP
jgi:hypothetical protein